MDLGIRTRFPKAADLARSMNSRRSTEEREIKLMRGGERLCEGFVQVNSGMIDLDYGGRSANSSYCSIARFSASGSLERSAGKVLLNLLFILSAT